MPFDHDDPYVQVECTVLVVREKSIQIEDTAGDKHWIPRSCIHGGDDRLLTRLEGEETTIKIRKWQAESKGLV
jgi:hypothetical protein